MVEETTTDLPEVRTFDTTRFGPVSLPADRILDFPRGLVGLPEARCFGFVHPEGEVGSLFWMQSCDDPELAFVVCDPRPHFPDYSIPLSREDQELLDIESAEEGIACVILVVPGDPREITANLRGPVVINPEARRGIQLALPGKFPVKAPLFPRTEDRGTESVDEGGAPCSS